MILLSQVQEKNNIVIFGIEQNFFSAHTEQKLQCISAKVTSACKHKTDLRYRKTGQKNKNLDINDKCWF